MKKRKWVFIDSPKSYDMYCDKCNGTNITWSEYEHKIWCYDCKIDTNGTPGIFDGPIPILSPDILGFSLWRYYIKSKAICRPIIDKNNHIVYRKVSKKLMNKYYSKRSTKEGNK